MAPDKKNYKIGLFVFLAFLGLVIYYGLKIVHFPPIDDYVPFLRKLCFSIFLILLIIAIGKFIERIIDNSKETEGTKYNLLRITRLVTIIFVLIVAVSFLFQNLYTLAVGFGVISLVLGFALQAPITSFIAWLYVVFRKPYQVGDRIQIAGMKGDVIEIHYLDTIFEECSGNYLGNDRKSGRIVHFPNSIVLKSEIINYSGPFLPFIWNETAVQIAYTSDLKFVEECFLDAAIQDFESQYPQKSIDAHSPWTPAVYFRVNKYAWMEAVISYPVEPTDTTGRRNRILKSVLPVFNDHPDKVQFPEGTHR